MYELIRAGENTWYMDCPARVGLVRTGEGHGVMIDGVEAARFGVDEQFVFHVPPGTHMFRVMYDWTAEDDCAVTEDRIESLGRAKKVVLEANSIYDYRIGFDSGSGRIKLFIDHVGKDIAQ